jgi:L-asparaginase
MGIISGHDLTVEAAVAKLYALFSMGMTGEELRRRMEESLCGELTVPSKIS